MGLYQSVYPANTNELIAGISEKAPSDMLIKLFYVKLWRSYGTTKNNVND